MAGRSRPTATGWLSRSETSRSGAYRPSPTIRARASRDHCGAGRDRRRIAAVCQKPIPSQASIRPPPARNAQTATVGQSDIESNAVPRCSTAGCLDVPSSPVVSSRADGRG